MYFKSKYNTLGKWNIKLSCLILLTSFLSLISCKKFTQVGPPATSISSANVYSTDATAAAVLTGIYSTLSGGSFNGGSILSTELFAGLSADEIALYSSLNVTYTQYYTNTLNNQTLNLWSYYYSTIYVANSAIAGLSSSNTLTPAVKQQLLGEAYFIRAFCYFYLVNLYGDVPLVISTNYTINDDLGRAAKSEVYTQIINDLQIAQNKLSANYLDGTLLNTTGDRVRPTKWAAAALLARVYLYNNDAKDAFTESSLVINNSSMSSSVRSLR